jgi:hypothetical protein
MASVTHTPALLPIRVDFVGTRRVKSSEVVYRGWYTEYTIHVTVGKLHSPRIVHRRYSAFAALHSRICEVLQFMKGTAEILTRIPQIPGKKLFGRLEPSFVQKRQEQLQVWMSAMLAIEAVRKLKSVLQFLEIPTSLVLSEESNVRLEVTHEIPANPVRLAYLVGSSDVTDPRNTVHVQNFSNSLFEILFNEPWWSSSFRIFEFNAGSGMIACTIARMSSANFGAASIVGGDVDPTYVEQFKQRIASARVASVVKPLLLQSSSGNDISGVYDAVASFFSLRRVQWSEYGTLIGNLARVCKSCGYLMFAEIDNFFVPSTVDNLDQDSNSDKTSRRSWKEHLLAHFSQYGIETIRIHRFHVFVRIDSDNEEAISWRSLRQDNAAASPRKLGFVTIPCTLVIGQGKLKERRQKKKKKKMEQVVST